MACGYGLSFEPIASCGKCDPETAGWGWRLDPAKRQSLLPAKVLGNFQRVFAHKAMLPLALTVGCNFAGFFLYVLAAPVFLLEHLKVSNQR